MLNIILILAQWCFAQKNFWIQKAEEVFVFKKVKNTVPWTYIINDLNGDDVIGTFYKKELQKTNQQEFRMIRNKKKR